MVYEKGPKCKLQAGKTKRNKKQVSLTKLDTRNTVGRQVKQESKSKNKTSPNKKDTSKGETEEA